MALDELVKRYTEDVDLILTKGYKFADQPEIEVFRPKAPEPPLGGPEDNLIAMV